MSLAIRQARPGDAGLALTFIRALAEYERLAHEVVATEADIEAALFGPSPRASPCGSTTSRPSGDAMGSTSKTSS